jgi:hypothetical protein
MANSKFCVKSARENGLLGNPVNKLGTIGAAPSPWTKWGIVARVAICSKVLNAAPAEFGVFVGAARKLYAAVLNNSLTARGLNLADKCKAFKEYFCTAEFCVYRGFSSISRTGAVWKKSEPIAGVTADAIARRGSTTLRFWKLNVNNEFHVVRNLVA